MICIDASWKAAHLLNSRYDYESKRFMRIDEWRDKQLNVLL